jgi:hypothetical protein
MIWHCQGMRPSTIILASLTILFAAATTVVAVLVRPDHAEGFLEVLRVGGFATIAFGAACVIGVINRRRRSRLKSEGEAHPGIVFVNAHATDSTAAELATWSPGVAVRFPCDLGFDRNGVTSWTRRDDTTGTPIAGRKDISGFDVFDQRTPLGSSSRWGIVLHLAPRDAGPAAVHLWVNDGQANQDEYTMHRTISRIKAALGKG